MRAVGTDTDCTLHDQHQHHHHHQHQQRRRQQQRNTRARTHTPLSDASPRQGHGQHLARVATTLGWCRSLSTAGSTQLRPERRSTKSASSAWTPARPNPAGTARCSSRARRAPSAAASSADPATASRGRGDPGRPRRMPAIGNYRISCTTPWRDREDGRSSTTLMCKSCPRDVCYPHLGLCST